MDKIVALCKSRGYVYAGSEIYGGLANTWDYGPLGVEYKNNVKRAWWKKFVQQSPYNVGLDSAILMNPQTWVASGHVGGFSDPLMDCKSCKSRFRADKLIEDYCHEKGLVVIGDVKRGDIGSTSAAYATGHLGKVQIGSKSYAAFDEDFATVNPYLGTDGIKPFVDVCREEKKGIFILVKTSNPSSGEFQDRLIDGRALYEYVGEKVTEWGADCIGASGYSAVGAVVGATYPEQGKILRKLMPKSFILVPGYGAQGGQGKDLVHFFNEDGLGAIVNSSRGIIAAYKQDKYKEQGITPENYADASRMAVEDMIADIAGALQNR